MATLQDVLVPDIGDFADVEIIEVLVAPGDSVNAEDPLITIESEKASIEVPSPLAGIVKELKVKVGDTVSEGALILTVDPTNGEAVAVVQEAPSAEPKKQPPTATADEVDSAPPPRVAAPSPPVSLPPLETSDALPHASPAVRRFARELGADLTGIPGSGPKGRILKQDVQNFVKGQLAQRPAAVGAAGAFTFPSMPAIDFTKFGEIETQPLSRIRKLAGANLQRNWVVVPHVTQHDEADITALETFRKEMKSQAEQRGARLTLLAFLLKACVAALREFPTFNASLDPAGESLIIKKYFHIGVAVDTKDGLVVPVIRDVDQKGVMDLAIELGEVSVRARDGKLSPRDMQGGCFSISSLGGIGGTFFTPIVNAPEVAILGVSRSGMKPVFVDGEFVPRLMLPLSLSYDHRVIDGAGAARFTSYLSAVLGDIRRLLL